MRRILAGFILLLLAFPTFAAMRTKPVEWTSGATHFQGYVVYDDATTSKRPGLLMVPDWYGVTASALDKARQQAGREYVVFVVDMYGKGVRPQNDGQAQGLVLPLLSQPEQMRTRMHAALAAFKAIKGAA